MPLQAGGSIIEGFMGLGLIVGVAALGVITGRAVVERQQQIGVLRAIGFRRRMVQLGFLLESSFVALTSIVVGTGLGLVVAHNVISRFPEHAEPAEPQVRRALDKPRDHLPRGLPGPLRHHVCACAPCVPRLPGPGAPLSASRHQNP
jgi:FtsX-like permease family